MRFKTHQEATVYLIRQGFESVGSDRFWRGDRSACIEERKAGDWEVFVF